MSDAGAAPPSAHPRVPPASLAVLAEATTLAGAAVGLFQAASLVNIGQPQGFAATVSMLAVMLLAYFCARMVGLRLETARIHKERAATYDRSMKLNGEIMRSFQRPH